jgi:hypothetical protein
MGKGKAVGVRAAGGFAVCRARLGGASLRYLQPDLSDGRYRLVQRLGSNCDAAVCAPGSTTTVVPIVTRL